MSSQRLVALAALILSITAINVAATERADPEKERIGLVLSGGGARGLAHVGVIRALEELRVPIYAVSGTSIGALVGGLYAAGLDSKELEAIVQEMDWKEALSDSPERSKLGQRRKSDDYDYALPLRLYVSQERLAVPLALVEGQQARQIIKHQLQGAEYLDDFDKLPRPFRAVATNLETGMPVIIDHGDLATAMRASMSIPGLLAPVQRQGVSLVDGGAAMNIPIDPARAMGTDKLVVVDIGSAPKATDDITSLLGVARQTLMLMTRRNSLEQLAKLGDEDVLILPAIGEIGILDFQKGDAVVELGYQATMAAADQLAPLALTQQEWAIYQSSLDRPQPLEPEIQFVDIDNNSRLSDEVIRSNISQPIGKPFDSDALREDINTIYGLGHWRTVDYEITEDERGAGLAITGRTDERDRLSLKLGLNLHSELSEQTDFNLGGSMLLRELNSRGGELYGAAQIGDEPAARLEYYQPIDYQSNFFFNASGNYDDYSVTSLGIEYDFAQSIGSWRLEQGRLKFSLGYNQGNNAQFRLGLLREHGNYNIDILGTADLPTGNYDEGGWFASYLYDSMDNIYFPGDGAFFFAEYEQLDTALGSDVTFERAQILGQLAYSFGEADRNTLLFTGKVKGSDGAEPTPENLHQLGGLFNLSGIPLNALSGRQLAFVMAQYQRRLSPEGLIPFEIYAGASLEGGQLWRDSSDIELGGLVTAGSIYLAVETPLGPLYLAYGLTEDSVDAFYLSLAWPFLGDRSPIAR